MTARKRGQGSAHGKGPNQTAKSASRQRPVVGHNLPGDPPLTQRVAAMIRVNQAGEYGAKRIYQGQMAVLGNGPAGPIIKHMAEQEERHLDSFNAMLTRRRVRPTALAPLWHVAGYALGAGTALLGEKAAMACTAAVEEVIDDHYGRQIEALPEDEAELASMITEFRAEEMEHRDIALEHGARTAPGWPLLRAAVRGASRLAIRLSERV